MYNKRLMKNIQFLSILLLGFVLVVSCKGVETSDTGTYGDGVSNPESAVNFADVYAQLDAADSLNVVMTGKVESVCQTKGCWMNLVDPTGSTDGEMFVQFFDYGFFMPKNLSGSEVIVEGTAYTEVTTVDELKHYAEDEGQSEEEIAAITESLFEKKFMATGVVVIK
jgi:hypothetical protein